MVAELQEEIIYQRPNALAPVFTHYCPGCTHGVAHRLVAEVIDELGVAGTNDRRRAGGLRRVRLQLL